VQFIDGSVTDDGGRSLLQVSKKGKILIGKRNAFRPYVSDLWKRAPVIRKAVWKFSMKMSKISERCRANVCEPFS
jgi:hypothetical protein